MKISFNSLQTGKHIQRELHKARRKNGHGVSIPFKRESISKAEQLTLHLPGLKKFQFPSNGKAYPKGNHQERE